jgi:peptidoglycan hydrolase-like protein with peptidoglycan-binding domain
MTTRYPVGYGRQTMTMPEMVARYGRLMEPEYARRLFNWLEAQGGNIGCGGGWRSTPNSCSSASRAGKSFHQTQQYANGFAGYAAMDLVVRNGDNVHRAPYWSEVDKQGTAEAERWGIHANISSETWHVHASEMDGFNSWVNAGRKNPVPGRPIPGLDAEIPAPAPPANPDWPEVDFEAGEYGLYPLNKNKATIFLNDNHPNPNELTEYCQAVLTNQCHIRAGGIDGYFGEQTQAAVVQMQGWNGLKQDGIVGPKSWACIDAYAVK